MLQGQAISLTLKEMCGDPEYGIAIRTWVQTHVRSENMQPVETVYLSIYYMVMDRPHGRKAGEYDCRYERL